MTCEISIHQVQVDWVGGVDRALTSLVSLDPAHISCPRPPAPLHGCPVGSPIRPALSLFTVTCNPAVTPLGFTADALCRTPVSGENIDPDHV